MNNKIYQIKSLSDAAFWGLILEHRFWDCNFDELHIHLKKDNHIIITKNNYTYKVRLMGRFFPFICFRTFNHLRFGDIEKLLPVLYRTQQNRLKTKNVVMMIETKLREN